MKNLNSFNFEKKVTLQKKIFWRFQLCCRTVSMAPAKGNNKAGLFTYEDRANGIDVRDYSVKFAKASPFSLNGFPYLQIGRWFRWDFAHFARENATNSDFF